MAKNVLIATLGESPIIVTSMVKALQVKKGVRIDQLHVIHPQSEKLIDLGYDIVEEHLEGQCVVVSCPLPFPDTSSHETSMEFLQNLSGLIQSHEHEGNNVYLSLAGGRKNMSALMAVTCQFFKCVRGLYHILDKHEDNSTKRNFHSIEAFFDFGDEERNEKLSPPAEDLILVEIPYPHLSNSVALRRYFSETQADPNEPTPVEIEGELDAFYREIFQKENREIFQKIELLGVYLSEEAHRRYKKVGGGEKSKRLKNCFRSMQNPQTLEKHTHPLSNSKTDCKCFKMGDTDERLFYYQTDSRIVAATITPHDEEYKQIANGNKPLWSHDHPAVVPSSELEDDSILIAPLGKSPMVVTQTFTLLSKCEGAKIKKVVVVHPKNAEIRNGVNLLREAFRQKGRKQGFERLKDPNFFQPIEIKDIQDLASDDDCKTYLEELVSVIETAQSKSIYLSLSGGRKGMTALTLFAAQHANIDAVYHTLITDIDLEKKIEEETTVTTLQSLSSRAKKVQRLFLDTYDESKFELFRVPVIPINPRGIG